MGTANRRMVAEALALRWLAGPWTEAAMLASAREVLELEARSQIGTVSARPGKPLRSRGEAPLRSGLPRASTPAAITVLVRRAILAFPRPPHGEPSLLSRWLERSTTLRASTSRTMATMQLRGVAVVQRWPVAPAQPPQRSRPFDIALPDTTGALAELLGLGSAGFDALVDAKQMGRHASATQSHYTFAWLRKRGGGARLLEAPKPRLRTAQRALLDRLLSKVPVHEAAHGFVRGRSVESFVAPHVARPLLLRMDLEDFFGSIHGGRIFGVFRQLGCSDAVARALAGLTTSSTPSRVLRARPSDSQEAERTFAARTRLRGPHLPQGAPTSPALANLVAFRLDLRLSGLAASVGARYTRYADDLAFSFDDGLRRVVFAALVTRIAQEEGFTIAHRKTRWMRPHERQLLGGLVLNVRAQAPRGDYDLVRAMVHRASTKGLAAVEADVLPSKLAAHLEGRAAWVSTGNPRRRTRLRR